MNRTEKTDAIAQMTEALGSAPHAFLIDFQGISVPDVTELRRQIRATGSEYVVVKNTLALRAIKDAPIGALSEHFTGMTAVAWSKTDIVQLAKVLHQFGKTNPKIKVKAALVEGRPVPAAALESLASLPTRPELVARLLGLMQSPVRRLVTVLSSPQRKLAMTISAVAEKKSAAA
ncbi:MAG: 50S ribosomal protein L10 [Thermoanaerobaculia bacterium]|nr:50S ribosomal protein L10 [Thermoanaerobaculia bacterium]MDX9733171.1 50S ribosomal protein L10 [Thermoanaerobaculia bacterium]HPA51926.1 50S ribosomal protein L10 [Thermoanaerobaculia bacterium]HQN08668.1 50S ribosomal protein L10 [Thermoanaerobaculia bacterium]HQP87740.1 50S ribosomal protein L10 [Thermoanaerobaculia bacterium]